MRPRPQPSPPQGPRIRRASWMSRVMMVTRRACSAHRLLSVCRARKARAGERQAGAGERLGVSGPSRVRTGWMALQRRRRRVSASCDREGKEGTHASSNRCTRYASVASWSASSADDCHRIGTSSSSVVKSSATSRTCDVTDRPREGEGAATGSAGVCAEVGGQTADARRARTAAWRSAGPSSAGICGSRAARPSLAGTDAASLLKRVVGWREQGGTQACQRADGRVRC